MRDADTGHQSLDEAIANPKPERPAPRLSPASRVVDSQQVATANPQRAEKPKKAGRLDASGPGQAHGEQQASALSSDLRLKIQRQNEAIDSFFEQIVASSTEEQLSPTGPALGSRFRFGQQSAHNSAFRHMHSAPVDFGAGRGSPDGSFSVPSSALDRAQDSSPEKEAPRVSRFTLDMNMRQPEPSCGSGARQPAHLPLEARVDPQLESLISSRASGSRKGLEQFAFNIRKSTTKTEASILSSPAWK